MRTMLLTIALLVPSVAQAVPVTFTFSAGAVNGWYTFDTQAPGQRRIFDDIDYGMVYQNAVTAFEVFVNNVLVMQNTGGDIYVANRRGDQGDSWYHVHLADGPDFRLYLELWNHNGLLPAEDPLTDAIPDTSAPEAMNRLALIDEVHGDTGHVAHEGPVAAMARASTQVSTLSTQPTTVPEPTTLLLFAAGMVGVAARRFF